ncbi:MAG TPA: efflux RND transporter periplasmic adaptor subunit [Candidatus Saccharimonadales bacterium]|nr:efflux RND transporter periplasmic adaptor subunit [Candidatus Saccharimonadales bacterium]
MARVSRKWAITGAVVAVVVAVAAFLLTHRGAKVQLLTGDVVRGPLDATVSATGTVNPVIMVHVGSQVSGTVAKLYADYNTKVREGQLLLELDPAIYQAQLAQAQANYEKAKVTTADALRALNRAKDLLAQNYIAIADRDAAQTAYDGAVASEKQALAAVKLAKVNLDHCTITSPVSGEVISRSVDVGQTVAASLQAPDLFLVANDLTRMQVETSIDEADIGKLAEGQEVSFTVDAFPDRTFHGRVTLIRSEPVTVQNVVSYTTVIEVANPDLKLRPGMTANVTVMVAHKDDVVKIPNAALRLKLPSAVAAQFGIKDEGRSRSGGGRSGQAGNSSTSVGGSQGGGPEVAGAAGAQAGRPGGAGGDTERGGHGARAARGDSSRTGHGPGGGHGAWAARGDSSRTGRGPGGAGQAGRGAFHPPSRIYVQVAPGKLKVVSVHTGLSDGTYTEIVSGDLEPGQKVVTGVLGALSASSQATPPPGMGGPFGGGPRR